MTTSSARAQLFFDQGLRLAYGFNHPEALRAFKEAARIDPDCAMAYWGWALVLGPNINLPMPPEVVEQAQRAIGMAMERRDKASARERDYIEALSRRYGREAGTDRAPLDRAYAGAMRAVHEKYPDDDDAATLYAEALMDLSPWSYWTKDGRPGPDTPEILRVLEDVLAQNPGTWERSTTTSTWWRRWIPSGRSPSPTVSGGWPRGPGTSSTCRPTSTSKSDDTRMPRPSTSTRSRPTRATSPSAAPRASIPLNYYPHNIHFLFWTRMMQGRSGTPWPRREGVAAASPRTSTATTGRSTRLS